MTLRQPAFGHGGPAEIDKESKCQTTSKSSLSLPAMSMCRIGLGSGDGLPVGPVRHDRDIGVLHHLNWNSLVRSEGFEPPTF
jgi:hypothetical protein